MALNDRQKLFVTEYIKLGNAYQAALNAKYKESSAIDASKWINPEILNNPSENERKKFKPEVFAELQRQMDELRSPVIAEAEEVLVYLSSVMRGESRSSVLARDQLGAERVIEKPPDEKEKLKAAELLGKRYSLFKENMDVKHTATVMIVDDLDG